MPITKSLTRPLTHRLTRAINDAGAGGASFTPDATFFAGAAGYAYDPFNYSTMSQDSAGATPVTATGQSLGRINDLSGNGNNRTQSTSGKKPLTSAAGYALDGFDDGMVGAANTASAAAWTHIVRFDRGADTSLVLMLGPIASTYWMASVTGGAGASNNVSTTPVSSIAVDGSPITNTQNDLFTALAGGPKTVVTKMSNLPHASWASTIKIGDYAAFVAGGTIGREILIQRDLTGTELADAIAWVNS